MSRRQLADEDGHRWDVEDQGPLTDREGPDDGTSAHQLRFVRDDGDERIREAPHSLNQMADAELRSLLTEGSIGDPNPGPDLEANRSDGYGDADD